jgi:hypothetical protein
MLYRLKNEVGLIADSIGWIYLPKRGQGGSHKAESCVFQKSPDLVTPRPCHAKLDGVCAIGAY